MKGKPLIIAFLLIVAAVAAVSIAVSFLIDKTEKSVASLPSPDGKYKAVTLTLRGGGSEPFCFDSVSVFFAIYPDGFAERDKAYEIFSAPCGTFTDGTPSPKVAWTSDTALQIAYSDKPAASSLRKLTMKAIDVTKTVHVTFVTKP